MGDTNEVLIDPVIALNRTLKISTAQFENALPHPGKAYGNSAGNEVYILDFEPRQKFQLDASNFDSIRFFFQWLLSDNSIYQVNYYMPVAENTEFDYETIFDPGLINQGTIVNTKKLNTYKGKRLFDLLIKDDVRPFRIGVAPLPESAPYIEVVQSADTNRFQVRLRRSNEIDALIKENMDKFKSQGYAEIPIGIVITDPLIPEHRKTVKYLLKQRVKKTNVKG